MLENLSELLARSQARHSHLCPRQVLGVRIGLAGLAAIGLPAPTPGKQALVFVETDGCFVDGIETATGCTVGHRTLRVEDYGKIAAAFINTGSGQAVRVSPRLRLREVAPAYAPEGTARYQAMLHAYQVMADADLLSIQAVALAHPLESILSQPTFRATCARCGEEIFNQREVARQGETLCQACAGSPYYQAR